MKLGRWRVLGIGWVVVSCLGFCLSGPAQASSVKPAVLPRASLRFEANRGQFAENVRFLARGPGYRLTLTRAGATLSRVGAEPVSLRVVDGREVEPSGRDVLPGVSNYFVGARAHTGVESFASVRYDAVKPGVSVVYHDAGERRLEYDLELDAGIDPRSVELELSGANDLSLAADGAVVLHTSAGELRIAPPISYQIDERGEREAVVSRYQLRAGNRLGFSVVGHDVRRPLVIDPVLLYSTYLGGSSPDQAYAIASDANGNSYVVGYTSSALFPTLGAVQAALAGGVYDAFVCKLNAAGALVYSTFLGGTGADVAYAVAADAQGNAYVTGVTFSTNFPTLAALQGTPGGKQDAFVTKLNAAGSALVFSSYLGGTHDDFAQGIALSGSNVVLVGTTFSSDFPRRNALRSTLNGTSDAFLTRLTASGSALDFSTFLGGSGQESARGVGVDGAGNLVLVGMTGSPNFPLANALQSTFGGGSSDAFVSKLGASGSALLYSTYLGGAFSDQALAVAVHASGSVTVAGDTTSTNFPVANAVQAALASPGKSDGFVSRLNNGGTTLAFSTYLGGSDVDSASGVAVDATNTAYVVGSTQSGNFPLKNPVAGQASYRGAGDGFASAFEATGSPLAYSTYLGGSDEDHAVGVSVQASGLTHVVGNTWSTNYPMLGAPIGSLVGAQDAFVTRLPSASATAVPASTGWSTLWLCSLLLGIALCCQPFRRPAA